ncbi:ABC transporter permease [Actinotalea sp. AC32]|nr:ABC transporter permease [Actinotalea sp. AC32]
MTALATPPTRPATPAVTTRPVTFGRVLAAEWLKVRTVRSTVWTLAVTVLAMVGISALFAWASTTMSDEQAASAGGTDLPALLSAGVNLGQLAVAVLGVLVVTSEYSTGMVRSTFAAVPRRLPVLAAKALVLTGVVVVATVVSMLLSYLVSLPFHDELGVTVDLADAEQLRRLAGLPLYLAGVALLGLAFGALLRHTAGAMTAVIGLLLVVETVFSLVPLRFFELVGPFLPSTAGARVMYGEETLAMIDGMRDTVSLTPWQGYGVMIAWVVVLGGVAAVLLRRRDA